MLGQASLFKPIGIKLRNRVEVRLVPLSYVRNMLESYHYLKRARTGRQLNYVVLIDGVVDGVITYAYPMMSADLLGVPSDELVEFARMWLKSNITHSASCAIGKTLRSLKKDWTRRFPDAKPLQLVVSWSDTTRHEGTVYKAANFKWHRCTKGGGVGNTKNSKRGARVSHSDYDHDKDCWVYWLDRRKP